MLELKSTADDLDEDEDDDFLQQHLDGLELLREAYSKLEEDYNNNNNNNDNNDDEYDNNNNNKQPSLAQWIRIAVGSDSKDKEGNVKQFSLELSTILEQRDNNNNNNNQLGGNSQARVNAFAVTLFALEDDFQSRAEDLLRLAFEEQQDRDYCLMLVNNNNKPSLLTNCFSLAVTRQVCCCYRCYCCCFC